MTHLRSLHQSLVLVCTAAFLIPSAFAVSGAAELTPETPSFFRLWVSPENRTEGLIEIIFSVDKADSAFKRTKATAIYLDMWDGKSHILKTELGPSASAWSGALTFAKRANAKLELDAATKEFFARKDVAFFRLSVRLSTLSSCQILFRADEPGADVTYWVSLDRFYRSQLRR